MTLLALDPGAERMGWAVLDRHTAHGPLLIDSGITRFPRHYLYNRSGDQVLDKKGKPKREEFQIYKVRLMEFWADEFPMLLDRYRPDQIVAEQQPAVGGGNYVAATQSELAKAAITVCRTIAYQQGIPWTEFGATQIHARLVVKVKGKKVTKVQVRNAVLGVFPELEPRKRELTNEADEADAIGIGLVGLGYKHGFRGTVSPHSP